MINLESRKEIKDCFVFTIEEKLFSGSTRIKEFFSNESLFFNIGDEEKIFSSMESLPPYKHDEIWPPHMVGLIKNEHGDIIIVRGERVEDGSGFLNTREKFESNDTGFYIEIFSEREADPNRAWFARGCFLLTPNSFYLKTV